MILALAIICWSGQGKTNIGNAGIDLDQVLQQNQLKVHCHGQCR